MAAALARNSALAESIVDAIVLKGSPNAALCPAQRCDQQRRDRNCSQGPSLSVGGQKRTGVGMYRKLLLATAAAALMTSASVAQTVNNAPQNSPAGAADQTKQAPRTGDSSQVGGTPSGNTRALESQ